MGREYSELSGQILAILGVLQILSAPHYVISSVLYGMSQHRPLALLRLFEAAANITLSIILVQSHGLVGVALGTVISHFIVAGIILPRLLDRRLGLSPFAWYVGVFGRTLLAAVPMAIAATGVRYYLPSDNLLEFFAKVGVLCAIYAACVYAIVLEPEQRGVVVQRARQVLRA
jgi:O-antigen/teichoic acid export membrane protein